MTYVTNGHKPSAGGVRVNGSTVTEIEEANRKFLSYLSQLELGGYVRTTIVDNAFSPYVEFQLHTKYADQLAPLGDTTELCKKLDLDTSNTSADLEREILVAMLLSPAPFQFPSYDELISAARIRKNIVEAARKTVLAFATYEAERPADFWSYDEDRGFVLLPGRPLITALKEATQTGQTGKRYTFSCRRAAEYIVLLGITKEAGSTNTELFDKLHQQAESRALKGREFERVFLRTLGSVSNPLPLKFFIPGDRTWFRNPDKTSSEITGYEGSWTFYLGGGSFANFWKDNETYSLTTKCLSIFHWRNATYRDQDGELQVDDNIVDALVAETMKDPVATERILQEMLRHQEPLGVFSGGCVEATREYPRHVCRGTTDLMLPDIDQN
jgi:hypothetical protein